MEIRGYRVGPLLDRVWKEILEDNVLGLAASTAYYFFFSLFPLILFAAPILSFIGDKQELVSRAMAQLSTTLPGEAVLLVRNVVEDVVFASAAPTLMSAGALLAAWAGSNIFTAMIDALNRAYDVTETRAWWKRRLLALASVVAASLVILVATAIFMGGEQIALWLGERLALGGAVAAAWAVIQYPIAVAMLAGLAWLIYVFLPNVRQRKVHALVGAAAATVLWIAITLVFRAYVSGYASYNKTYGTIGGVIVLLMWMYLSMVALLAGGELASELHHGTGATSSPSGTLYGDRLSNGGVPGSASTEKIIELVPPEKRRRRRP